MIYVRPPAAAGRFYDIDAAMLRKQLDVAFRKDAGQERPRLRKRIVGAVVPHAGYEYSGWVAAHFYSLLDQNSPRNYIILGPNHYMFGSKFATMKNGLWKTPLGGVIVHEKMASDLINECKLLEVDVIPHQNDHSIEVQLPFLQHVFKDDLKFVPISISNDAPEAGLLKDCQALGGSIADMINKSGEKWVVVASSDFSHYVPQDVAEETDSALIKAITKLDEKSFFEQVKSLNASACGFGPIATVMVAAKRLGCRKGKLLKYATSGSVTGDISSVVGYASMIF